MSDETPWSAYVAAAPTSGPKTASGRGPVTNGPNWTSADARDSTCSTTTSHTTGRHRGDGSRPSGNRSKMSGSSPLERLQKVSAQSRSEPSGVGTSTPADQSEVAIPPASVRI